MIAKYESLIPKLKYVKGNKAIDEYNTSECVVCMDVFIEGKIIRRLPTCHHIFHDKCLMKWLDGPTQQQSQKCPMCNAELTVEIIEKAISEEQQKNKKKNGLSRLFGY